MLRGLKLRRGYRFRFLWLGGAYYFWSGVPLDCRVRFSYPCARRLLAIGLFIFSESREIREFGDGCYL